MAILYQSFELFAVFRCCHCHKLFNQLFIFCNFMLIKRAFLDSFYLTSKSALDGWLEFVLYFWGIFWLHQSPPSLKRKVKRKWNKWWIAHIIRKREWLISWASFNEVLSGKLICSGIDKGKEKMEINIDSDGLQCIYFKRTRSMKKEILWPL